MESLSLYFFSLRCVVSGAAIVLALLLATGYKAKWATHKNTTTTSNNKPKGEGKRGLSLALCFALARLHQQASLASECKAWRARELPWQCEREISSLIHVCFGSFSIKGERERGLLLLSSLFEAIANSCESNVREREREKELQVFRALLATSCARKPKPLTQN